jgi:hypothetical protein
MQNNVRNERSEIWEIRGLRGYADVGRCPLCPGKENAIHVPFNCSEKKNSEKTWLMMKTEIAYKFVLCQTLQD